MPLSHHRLQFTACRHSWTETATAKILIVDDDEGVTQTFARMLRLEGYQVATAVSAETGLQEADRQPPGRHHSRPAHAAASTASDSCAGFARTTTTAASPSPSSPATISSTTRCPAELRELGAELRFKPLWLEDLVGLARNLLKVTH